MTTPSILVSGSSGFLGIRFTKYLETLGVSHLALTRNPIPSTLFKKNLSAGPDYQGLYKKALSDIDTVVHLAGPAHHLGKEPSLDFFDHSNSRIIKAILFALRESKLKTFVYISSAGVYGDKTSGSHKFTVNSPSAPESNYAISKLATENLLKSLCSSQDINLHIVRPPLVIGKNPTGNFAKFLSLVDSPFPLPFDSLVSTRSYITVPNLCYFLYLLCDHQLPPLTKSLPSDITCSLSELVHLVSPEKKTFHMHPSLIYLSAFILRRLPQLEKMNSCFVVENSSTYFGELAFPLSPSSEFS